MAIRFEFVDQIAVDATGRVQSCICRIPVPLFSAGAEQVWQPEERRQAVR
jgi:hypothetical protein